MLELVLESTVQLKETSSGNASRTIQEIDNLVSALTHFELTPLQAKIYVNLLRLGSSTARNISRFIGVNRVDVYRVLRELGKRGLVEVNMSNPAVYTASHPRLVLETLLSEAEDHVRSLKDRAGELLLSLESLRAPLIGIDQDAKNTFFRLLSGHQIVHRCMDMFDQANKEILRIIPGDTLSFHLRESFFEHYQNCVRRGVEIKIITDITKRNLYESEEFSKIIKIRHTNDVSRSLKYIVADDSEVMVMLNSPIQSTRGSTAFVSNNKGLVRGFKLDFEALWKRSQDSKQRIRLLASSHAKGSA